MKLLVVTPEYLPSAGGGIITFYRHLLPALVRAGVRVTALVGSATTQSDLDTEIEGVRVIGLSEERFQRHLGMFAAWQAFPALRRHLAAAWALHEQARTLGHFDAVEAVDWGWLFAPWVIARDAPLLIRGHGSAGQIALREPDPDLVPFEAALVAMERELMRRASKRATYSRMHAEAWQRDVDRAVDYVPAALPLLGEPASADEDHLLVIARVQRWKGPQVLGAALERLDQPPRVRWVGRDVPDFEHRSPSTLATLRERFPRAWTRHVDHHGTTSSEQVLEWTRRARAVLVPSTWDVFNFAGAEAMACGAVVVASTGAGMAGLIVDGENGFRVNAEDSAALADALRRLAALDDAGRARIGVAARETIRRELDPDGAAAANLELYRQLHPAEPAHDALDTMLSPRADARASTAFLKQYPLRDLLGHAWSRLRHRWRA